MATLPSISPSQQTLVLQLLQDPSCSLESIADSLNWPLEHLTLYLTSAEGLALIAECELAIAVRTRIAAAAQLHAAINALGLMLSEYASTANKIPFDDRKTSTHELREVQRSNARRAAHLLFRLAHFTPRPIKSYAPAPSHTSIQPAEPAAQPMHSNTALSPAPSQSTTQRSLDHYQLKPTLDIPASRSLTHHAEGVNVNSRGSPQSGTPGNSEQFTSHREAVQASSSPRELNQERAESSLSLNDSTTPSDDHPSLSRIALRLIPASTVPP